MAPIPRKYVAVYVLLFVLSVAVAIVGAIREGGPWVEMILHTAHNLEPLALVAAPVTYGIVELITMLAEIFLKKREEKGVLRGRTEGRSEGRTEGRAETLDLVASEVGLTPEQRKAIEEALKARDK